MNYNATGTRGDLLGYTEGSATPLPFNATTPATTGSTVGVGTYYFPLGGEQGPVPVETAYISAFMLFAATVAGTLTIEVTNLPKTLSGSNQGGGDVNDWDAASSGGWVQWNPTLSGALYANINGSGNSVTAFTYTLGGTTLGGLIANIVSCGFQRIRLKLVTTVGGLVRPNAHGKLGS